MRMPTIDRSHGYARLPPAGQSRDLDRERTPVGPERPADPVDRERACFAVDAEPLHPDGAAGIVMLRSSIGLRRVATTRHLAPIIADRPGRRHTRRHTSSHDWCSVSRSPITLSVTLSVKMRSVSATVIFSSPGTYSCLSTAILELSACPALASGITSRIECDPSVTRAIAIYPLEPSRR